MGGVGRWGVEDSNKKEKLLKDKDNNVVLVGEEGEYKEVNDNGKFHENKSIN